MIEQLEFARRWGIEALDFARWAVWALINIAVCWKLRGTSTAWHRVLVCELLGLLFAVLEFAFLRTLLDRSRSRKDIEKRLESVFFQKTLAEQSDVSATQHKPQLEDLAFRYRESRKDGNVRLGALGFVIALALLVLYLPLPSQSAQERPQSPTTLQLSPELKEDLGKILNRMCPPCPGAVVCPLPPVCPQLSPGSGVPKGEGASGSTIPAWAVVLGIVAIIAAAVVIFRRPETAPIFGVAQLAREAVKNAEHLARLPGVLFLPIIVLFLAIAVLFLLAGYRAIVQRTSSGGTEKQGDSDTKRFLAGLMGKGDKSSTGNLFLTVGFSILVLTWIIVLVSYQPVPVGTNGPAPTPTPPSNTPTAHTFSLANQSLPRPTFAPGHSDHPEHFEDLQKALSDQAKEGDLLLLLGSTDCTSRKKGNEGLALERANTVEERLKSEMNGKHVSIAMGNLPYHTACKESPESRAVIPFLVHLSYGAGSQ